MSLSDYLLATLGVYGLPVLFGALLVGAAGVPLPASLVRASKEEIEGLQRTGAFKPALAAARGAMGGINPFARGKTAPK